MAYRLPCPHPNCPITFKSKRGQKHHIHTVHFRSLLNRQINVQRDEEYKVNDHHWQDQEYDGHHHQSADASGPDDTHSTHNRSYVSSVNDLDPPVGKRKEHPHLTGMCALYVMNTH